MSYADDILVNTDVTHYRGVDVEYLRFIYDAVCNQGVDVNSDATKAFYEGALYGANYARDCMMRDFEMQISDMVGKITYGKE